MKTFSSLLRRMAPALLLGMLSAVLFPLLGALWIVLYVETMQEFEPVETAAEITVRADQATGLSHVVVGRLELGQNPDSDSAEPRHVEIEFVNGTPVGVRNIAVRRRLYMVYADGELSDREHLLADGDRIRAGGSVWTVSTPAAQASAELSLRDEATGATVLSLPQFLDVLKGGPTPLLAKRAEIGGRISRIPNTEDGSLGWRSIATAAALDRSLPPVLVSHPSLPEKALSLTGRDYGYVISPNSIRVTQICANNGKCQEIGRQFWPFRHATLGPLQEIVIGRTGYRVTIKADAVSFTPMNRNHWLTEARAREIHDAPRVAVDTLFAPGGTRARGLSAGADETLEAQIAAGAAEALLPDDQSGHEAWPAAFLSLAALFVVVFTFTGAVTWRAGLSAAVLATILWLLSAAIAPGASSYALLEDVEVFALLTAVLSAAWLCARILKLSQGGEAMRRHAMRLSALHLRRMRWLTPKRMRALETVATSLTAGACAAVLYVVPSASHPDGARIGEAMSAVVLLFTAAGLLIGGVCRSIWLMVFWACLMIIVMLGAVSLGKLTFGQDYSRYLTLYERHIMALGLIAGGAALLALSPPPAVVRSLQGLLRVAGWSVRLPPVSTVVLLLLVIALGTLVAALGWGSVKLMLLGDGLTATFIIGALALAALLGLMTRFGLVRLPGLVGRAITWSGMTKVPVPSFVVLAGSAVLGVVIFLTPETGIAGLQPSEAAKTWLAMLSAIFLARWFETGLWKRAHQRGPSLLWPIIGFGLVTIAFAAGSFLNFDLSPAAIVLTMAAVVVIVTTATAIAARFPAAVILLLGLIASAVALALDGLSQWLTFGLALALALLLMGSGGGRRQVELTPWMLRSPIGMLRFRRTSPIALLARAMKAFKHLEAPVLALALVAVGVLYWQVTKLGDISALAGYDAQFMSVDLPVTPLERGLSYLDGALFRTSDSDGLIIIDYPDLSHQVRSSREILGATGCSLIDRIQALAVRHFDISESSYLSWLLTASVQDVCPLSATVFPLDGPLHPAVTRLPAVQDDFAPTLLVSNFGLDAGALLVIAQVGMVVSLIALGGVSVLKTRREMGLRGLSLLAAITLANQCLILISQFVLSWGNMAGLTPVVGQPMTFISMGASHHLFFAAPTVLTAVIVAQLNNSMSARYARRPRVFTGRALRTYMLPANARDA